VLADGREAHAEDGAAERKDDVVRLAANERSVFTTRAGEERVEG
jgi:hypothetical protein